MPVSGRNRYPARGGSYRTIIAAASTVCGAQPSGFNVSCLLDTGHEGPHRWWDKNGDLKWVPHDEPWREEPHA